FLEARKMHAIFADCFLNDEWGGSYGGPKWYDCADAVIQLDNEVLEFLKNPSDATFKNIMMAMNRAINCAHNGGWWFNKFISESVFNCINSEHLPTILDATRFMYENPPKKVR